MEVEEKTSCRQLVMPSSSGGNEDRTHLGWGSDGADDLEAVREKSLGDVNSDKARRASEEDLEGVEQVRWRGDPEEVSSSACCARPPGNARTD